MRKCYISGKITGLSQDEYMKRFMDGEQTMKKAGYSVINPAKVNAMMPIDMTWDEYMKMSLTMLSFCDTIYMLSNYTDSKGAMLELSKAQERKMDIFFE